MRSPFWFTTVIFLAAAIHGQILYDSDVFARNRQMAMEQSSFAQMLRPEDGGAKSDVKLVMNSMKSPPMQDSPDNEEALLKGEKHKSTSAKKRSGHKKLPRPEPEHPLESLQEQHSPLPKILLPRQKKFAEAHFPLNSREGHKNRVFGWPKKVLVSEYEEEPEDEEDAYGLPKIIDEDEDDVRSNYQITPRKYSSDEDLSVDSEENEKEKSALPKVQIADAGNQSNPVPDPSNPSPVVVNVSSTKQVETNSTTKPKVNTTKATTSEPTTTTVTTTEVTTTEATTATNNATSNTSTNTSTTSTAKTKETEFTTKAPPTIPTKHTKHSTTTKPHNGTENANSKSKASILKFSSYDRTGKAMFIIAILFSVANFAMSVAWVVFCFKAKCKKGKKGKKKAKPAAKLSKQGANSKGSKASGSTKISAPINSSAKTTPSAKNSVAIASGSTKSSTKSSASAKSSASTDPSKRYLAGQDFDESEDIHGQDSSDGGYLGFRKLPKTRL